MEPLQNGTQGTYTQIGVLLGGRPVYQQVGGLGLFMYWGNGYWKIGASYTSSASAESYRLHSVSANATSPLQCPTEGGMGWSVYDPTSRRWWGSEYTNFFGTYTTDWSLLRGPSYNITVTCLPIASPEPLACGCSTLRIAGAENVQASSMGAYTQMPIWYEGRPVFHNAASNRFLHYFPGTADWLVSSDYTRTMYGISSFSGDGAACPVAASDYRASLGAGSHSAHRIAVRCDEPAPHPTCCDEVTVSGSGGGLASHFGAFTHLPGVFSASVSLVGGGTSCDSSGRPLFYNPATSMYLYYCPGYLVSSGTQIFWFVSDDYTSRTTTVASFADGLDSCPTSVSDWRATRTACSSSTSCECGETVSNCASAAAACAACGSASNYNCADPGSYTCDLTGNGGDVISGTSYWTSAQNIDVSCGPPNPPPPLPSLPPVASPPPSPPLPLGQAAVEQHVVRVEMVAAGDNPQSISAAQRTQLAAAIANRAQVGVARVSVNVIAASLLLVFEVSAIDAPDASAIAARLVAAMPAPEDANTVLAAALATAGIAIITAPQVQVNMRYVAGSSLPPPPPAPNVLHSSLYGGHGGSDCSGPPLDVQTVRVGVCVVTPGGYAQRLLACESGVATLHTYDGSTCTGSFALQTEAADGSCRPFGQRSIISSCAFDDGTTSPPPPPPPLHLKQSLHATADCSDDALITQRAAPEQCILTPSGYGQILEACTAGVATLRSYDTPDCSGSYTHEHWAADGSCLDFSSSYSYDQQPQYVSARCVAAPVGSFSAEDDSGSTAIIVAAAAACVVLCCALVACVAVRRQRNSVPKLGTGTAAFPAVAQTSAVELQVHAVAPPNAPSSTPGVAAAAAQNAEPSVAKDAKEKLQKLKELLHAGLIDQKDYEQKKDDILTAMLGVGDKV